MFRKYELPHRSLQYSGGCWFLVSLLSIDDRAKRKGSVMSS